MSHVLGHHLKLDAPEFNGVSFVTLEKGMPSVIKSKGDAVVFDDEVLRFNSQMLVSSKRMQESLQDAAKEICLSMRQERKCLQLSFFEPLLIGNKCILNSQIFSLQFLFALNDYQRLEYKFCCFADGLKFNITRKPELDEICYDELINPIQTDFVLFNSKEFSKNNVVHQANLILQDIAKSETIQAITLDFRVDGQRYYFFHYLLREEDQFWDLHFDRPLNFMDPAFIQQAQTTDASKYVLYAFMSNNISEQYKNVEYNMSSIERIIEYTEGIKTVGQLMQFDALPINLEHNSLIEEMFTYFIMKEFPIVSTITISQSSVNETVKVALVACHSITQLQSTYEPRRGAGMDISEHTSATLFLNVASLLDPVPIKCGTVELSKTRAKVDEDPDKNTHTDALAKLAELSQNQAKIYSNFHLESQKNQLKLAEMEQQNQQFADSIRLEMQQEEEQAASRLENERKAQQRRAAIALNCQKEIADAQMAVTELRYARKEIGEKIGRFRSLRNEAIDYFKNPQIERTALYYASLSNKLTSLAQENQEMGQILSDKVTEIEWLDGEAAKYASRDFSEEQKTRIAEATEKNRTELLQKWTEWYNYQSHKLQFMGPYK